MSLIGAVATLNRLSKIQPVLENHLYADQFEFQRRHAQGRVCNVGCNTDGAGFGKASPQNLNVDLFWVDPVTNMKLATDMIADARDLPFRGEFDTVVLGEILEHMERVDAVQALKSANRALKTIGRVVITIPHDGRRARGTEPPLIPGKEFYAPGIHAHHYREITRLELLEWIEEAGLTPMIIGEISYIWGERGTGVVAC